MVNNNQQSLEQTLARTEADAAATLTAVSALTAALRKFRITIPTPA